MRPYRKVIDAQEVASQEKQVREVTDYISVLNKNHKRLCDAAKPVSKKRESSALNSIPSSLQQDFIQFLNDVCEDNENPHALSAALHSSDAFLDLISSENESLDAARENRRLLEELTKQFVN